ncbi:MAG: phage antirepressor KilAC domain-containing protein [Janthinobacterium lividum]
MESLQIILADGRLAQSDKLREYFSGIFQAEESGEQYPVELGHVWPIGYAAKEGAVKALRKQFVQDVDFQVFVQLAENPQGGRPAESYRLTVACAEWLTVRANREVFEVYRHCRQAVKNLLKGSLPDFSDPAAAAEAWATEYRAKQQALAQASQAAAQLEMARPKIEFAEAVALAAGTMSMAKAAKLLKIKGVGRNKLFRMLRTDSIFRTNNEPYQEHIDAGRFELEAQPFKAGQKGPRLGVTTRVTPVGLEWLQKRYKQAA